MTISRQGMGLFLFTPESDADREWLAENVDAEPWQYLGDSLAVDTRFAVQLANAMIADGIIGEEELEVS